VTVRASTGAASPCWSSTSVHTAWRTSVLMPPLMGTTQPRPGLGAAGHPGVLAVEPLHAHDLAAQPHNDVKRPGGGGEVGAAAPSVGGRLAEQVLRRRVRPRGRGRHDVGSCTPASTSSRRARTSSSRTARIVSGPAVTVRANGGQSCSGVTISPKCGVRAAPTRLSPSVPTACVDSAAGVQSFGPGRGRLVLRCSAAPAGEQVAAGGEEDQQ